MEIEQVDDYTLIFKFAAPNGLFTLRLANNAGSDLVRFPKHYLSQFLPEFNEELDAVVAEAGFDNWVRLFESKIDGLNLDLPVLTAWKVTEVGETVIAERNPYYWKIDTDFNQLPYIDRIVFKGIDSLDAFSEAITPSEGVATLVFGDEFNQFSINNANLSELTSVVLTSSNSTSMALGLNLNHPDPVLQTAFGNKNVRIALSHAIHRARIIDEVYSGNSQPYQVAPRPESPFFDEAMAYQYTEYDVALANQMLDEAGYAERDAENYRLDSDGNRITFAFETSNTAGATFSILTRVVEDWQAVGIDVSLKVLSPEENQASNERLFSAAHDTYVSEAVGGLDVILQPSYYFPLHPFASFYASGWANWNVSPPLGMPIEPPPAIQRQMQLYAELQTTTDANQQALLMAELLQIAQEEFMVIGTVLAPDGRLLTSANLRNVPLFMPRAFDYPAPAPSNPSQYFIDTQGS